MTSMYYKKKETRIMSLKYKHAKNISPKGTAEKNQIYVFKDTFAFYVGENNSFKNIYTELYWVAMFTQVE